MPAVLRNGRGAAPQKEVEEEYNTTQTPETDIRYSSRTRPSPYLLLIYPVILGIGSLYSVISPIASSQFSSKSQSLPLAPGVTSDLNTPPQIPAAANYFAGKHNILNVYFVKIGWFWTTLAFVLLHAVNTFTRSRSTTQRKNQLPHYIQTTIRYAIITTAWLLTTQWFFGPALVDRSFTITGGHCEAPATKLESTGSAATTSDPTAALDMSFISSGPSCKAIGGRWRGGHDISGHVFLLVLSSASLLYELLIADSHSSHPSVSPQAAAKLAHEMSEEERSAVGGWESETAARVRIWTRYFVYTVVGLDFWMLMMTAIWFHTWLEKLSGLALATTTVWIVYFAPEFWIRWADFVGGI